MKFSVCLTCILAVTMQCASSQHHKEFDSGVAKFRAQDYDAVIEAFSLILNTPDHNKRFDADLYFYRGQSYYYQKEYTKALDDLNERLFTNDYSKGLIYWYKARCYDKLGQIPDATTNYDQAVTLVQPYKKVSLQILKDRAEFHARNGELAGAERDRKLAQKLEGSMQHSSVINAKTNSDTILLSNQSSAAKIGASFNQDDRLKSSYDDGSKSPYEDEIVKYTNRRNAGIPLTVLGGILLAAGYQMMENYDSENYSAGDGLLVTGLGAGCLAAGIPLLISGFRGVRKYKKRTEKLSVRYYMNPRSNGISINYRF